MCSMSRELERVSLSGDSFRCAICLDTARDAVESDCCHQLYCAACTQQLSRCPTCRQWDFSVRGNVIVRRLINEIPTPCEHCKQMVARGDLDAHKVACARRQSACAALGGAQNDFRKILLHLIRAGLYVSFLYFFVKRLHR